MSDQRYTVSVKNGAGWRRYSGLRLLISVGQSYHNGSKLAAVVDWINRNPSVDTVQIAVNDLLQGWNDLANNIAGGKAFKDAERKGDEWLGEHEDILCSFTSASVSVTRWGLWLDHPDYAATQNKLSELLKREENGLASSIISASQEILARRTKHVPVSDPQRFLDYSREFIKEELIVLALMHKDECPSMADVYPGSVLPCMRWFNDARQELPAELEPLKNRYFCRIDFNRATEQQHAGLHSRSWGFRQVGAPFPSPLG
jgi:hypothetical protein